jgi:hypothetical protein
VIRDVLLLFPELVLPPNEPSRLRVESFVVSKKECLVDCLLKIPDLDAAANSGIAQLLFILGRRRKLQRFLSEFEKNIDFEALKRFAELKIEEARSANQTEMVRDLLQLTDNRDALKWLIEVDPILALPLFADGRKVIEDPPYCFAAVIFAGKVGAMELIDQFRKFEVGADRKVLVMVAKQLGIVLRGKNFGDARLIRNVRNEEARRIIGREIGLQEDILLENRNQFVKEVKELIRKDLSTVDVRMVLEQLKDYVFDEEMEELFQEWYLILKRAALREGLRGELLAAELVEKRYELVALQTERIEACNVICQSCQKKFRIGEMVTRMTDGTYRHPGCLS